MSALFKAEWTDLHDHYPPVDCLHACLSGLIKTLPPSHCCPLNRTHCQAPHPNLLPYKVWSQQDRPGRRKRAERKTKGGEKQSKPELKRTSTTLLWQKKEEGPGLKTGRGFWQYRQHLQHQLQAFNGLDFTETWHWVTEKDNYNKCA